MRHWLVSIKEVGNPDVLHPELIGNYDLADVREHFGLYSPDIEWYSIEEKKDSHVRNYMEMVDYMNGVDQRPKNELYGYEKNAYGVPDPYDPDFAAKERGLI